jgi:hypothetical protein
MRAAVASTLERFGHRFEVGAESGEWLQVRYEKDGRAWIGFVHSRYIEEE